MCRNSPTSIVQDHLTKDLYANQYCAQCNSVKRITPCEEKMVFYDVISTTTSENEESDITLSTTTASTTSAVTTSTSEENEMVTGTSTSSTSTTTTSSPISNSDEEGRIPSGSVLVWDSTNPRGGISSPGNDVNANGQRFPEGTRIVPDPSNPRGFVIVQNKQNGTTSEAEVGGFPSGTRLLVGPEREPRGEAVTPANLHSPTEENESDESSNTESAESSDDTGITTERGVIVDSAGDKTVSEEISTETVTKLPKTNLSTDRGIIEVSTEQDAIDFSTERSVIVVSTEKVSSSSKPAEEPIAGKPRKGLRQRLSESSAMRKNL